MRGGMWLLALALVTGWGLGIRARLAWLERYRLEERMTHWVGG